MNMFYNYAIYNKRVLVEYVYVSFINDLYAYKKKGYKIRMTTSESSDAQRWCLLNKGGVGFELKPLHVILETLKLVPTTAMSGT